MKKDKTYSIEQAVAEVYLWPSWKLETCYAQPEQVARAKQREKEGFIKVAIFANAGPPTHKISNYIASDIYLLTEKEYLLLKNYVDKNCFSLFKNHTNGEVGFYEVRVIYNESYFVYLPLLLKESLKDIDDNTRKQIEKQQEIAEAERRLQTLKAELQHIEKLK